MILIMATVALPPKGRAVLYYVTAIYVPAVAALQATFVSLGMTQPVWLTIMLVFSGFLGGAFGLTAASNTPIPQKDLGNEDHQTRAELPDTG